MSFFDEGDEPRTAIRSPQPPPRRASAPARRGAADDRTLLLRRGGAAAVVLIVLIALVLIVKTVLNHQAVAGLKNYDTEVASLVSSEQSGVRGPFFRAIDNAFGSSNPAEVPTTLQQYVSQEADYYHQAEGWSVPAQMVGAQRYFVEALGLRYEALQGIEGEMTQALAVSGGQNAAIKLIAGEMEKLLASDVMYSARVAPLIAQALASAGITGQLTATSAFLPDVGWLVPQNVAQRILGYVPSSLGGLPTNGSPGSALTAVAVQAADGTTTPLATSGANTFTYTPAGITFVLTVLNSGNLEEHGVQTEVYFHKQGLNTSCLESRGQIPTTKPGGSYTSSIVFAPTSSCVSGFFNVPLLMTAEAVPLPGENDKTNNVQHFLVEFTH